MLDVKQALAPEQKASIEWLTEFQLDNRNRWLQQSWPDKKTESWKYSSLKPIERLIEASASEKNSTKQDLPAVLQKLAIADFETVDVVFVDGEFNTEYSTLNELPSGLTVTLFSEASTEQRDVIKNQLGTIANADTHTFVALNNSTLQEGVLVEVERNVSVQKPLRILWLSGAEANKENKANTRSAMAQRVLLIANESSEATILEQFASVEDEQPSFSHGVSEFLVNDNAFLRHYRLHQENEHVSLVSGVHAKLMRNANFNSFYLAFGSALKRVDIVVEHRGEGSHSELSGVYLPRNKQHVDFHTCIEHAVPNCTSNEVFRGIISDSAKAVFNGRIHIHKDAQKTKAMLSNKNLLTSNKAEVDTKPELEIYADDVQCAHGATIAQLDTYALHYLKTRGVAEAEAKVMLSFGFINALVDKVKHQSIAAYLRPMIANTFAKDPSLTRHIASGE